MTTGQVSCSRENNIREFPPNSPFPQVYRVENSYPLVKIEFRSLQLSQDFMELMVTFEDRRNSNQKIELTYKARIMGFYEFVENGMLGYFPGEDKGLALNFKPEEIGPFLKDEKTNSFQTSFRDNLFSYRGIILKDISPCSEPIAAPLDVFLNFNWTRSLPNSKFAFQVRYSMFRRINGEIVPFSKKVTFEEVQKFFSVPNHVGTPSSSQSFALITRFQDVRKFYFPFFKKKKF